MDYSKIVKIVDNMGLRLKSLKTRISLGEYLPEEIIQQCIGILSDFYTELKEATGE